jgi:hypothetical protein
MVRVKVKLGAMVVKIRNDCCPQSQNVEIQTYPPHVSVPNRMYTVHRRIYRIPPQIEPQPPQIEPHTPQIERNQRNSTHFRNSCGFSADFVRSTTVHMRLEMRWLRMTIRETFFVTLKIQKVSANMDTDRCVCPRYTYGSCGRYVFICDEYGYHT